MPHTESLPKCLLPVDGNRPVLELQLRALRDGGIEEARIMVGFQAEKVEAFLATRPVPGIRVETVFNPFFDSTENLVTAWLARPEMTDDFLLLNGDTLFEPAVLDRLLTAPSAPITLVVNGKPQYDDDDMKVSLGAKGRIKAISKKLANDVVDGESIGLMRFMGTGVQAFRAGLDHAVRTQRGRGAYYLSVIDELTSQLPVLTASMTGLWWGELDSPEDLAKIRAEVAVLRRERGESLASSQDGQVVTPIGERIKQVDSPRPARWRKRSAALAVGGDLP